MIDVRARNKWLQAKLALERLEGPVGKWLSIVPEAQRPDPAGRGVRSMASLLSDFGIEELTLAEGQWLLDRIESNDWKTYATTAEEAIISFFGVQRATRGLPPKRMDYLRRAFPHYFQ